MFKSLNSSFIPHAARLLRQQRRNMNIVSRSFSSNNPINHEPQGSFMNAQQGGQAAAINATDFKQHAMPQISFLERLSKLAYVGPATKFLVDSWRMTFPSDHYQISREETRRQAKEIAEKEKNKKEYSEEELMKMQGAIPESMRTALTQTVGEEAAEQITLGARVKTAVKEKINDTWVAKKIYSTDKYKNIEKEYTEFKTVMGEFKEDCKDHLAMSQNPAVVVSLLAYNKVTTESGTAQAIKETRKYIKDFDLYQLEKDFKDIFSDVFSAYLKGDLTYIENTCQDAGLAYFKTLIKKREVAGVYPKYDYLLEAEDADFWGGRMGDGSLPCFRFTIRVQEIHCNVSKKTNKIVDGANDRVIQNKYNVELRLHDTPDLENVGHRWAISEVIPMEAVALLA